MRIQNLNNPDAPFNRFRGQFESHYHLPRRGAALRLVWSSGLSFGAHVWRGGEAVLNQHIFRVDFDEATLDKRFFRYAINQKLDAELIDIAHGGVGLRHVTKGTFERTLVAVPPLNEQKRIADKLDAVLARVDACRERLDRVPAILKRFRQAVLAAATSGKLTEEWRQTRQQYSALIRWADRGNRGTWSRSRNGRAVCQVLNMSDNGVRLLRPGNLHVSGRLKWNDDTNHCAMLHGLGTCQEFPHSLRSRSRCIY